MVVCLQFLFKKYINLVLRALFFLLVLLKTEEKDLQLFPFWLTYLLAHRCSAGGSFAS